MATVVLPVEAMAAQQRKAIQIADSSNQTGGIAAWTSAAEHDFIYFGSWQNDEQQTEPLKWMVLDTKTNMAGAKQGDGLFVLSSALFNDPATGGGIYFQKDYHLYNGTLYKGAVYGGSKALMNAWQESDAQKWCRDFSGQSGSRKEYLFGSFASGVPTAFSNQEAAAIIETSRNDDLYTSGRYAYQYAAADGILARDKVFFLSAQEAETYFPKGASTTGQGAWWLRSPSANIGSHSGVVHSGGAAGLYTCYTAPARPAFNLDLKDVLFTSVAAGGKTSEGGLTKIAETAADEWKLTIRDDSRKGFRAALDSETASIVTPGQRINLTYSGAKPGSNEYVSAILTDASGKALYYGRLANNCTSGKINLAIPADLGLGAYTLKVFSEQYNGDRNTDYASPFVGIALTVTDDDVPAAVIPPRTGDGSPIGLWFSMCFISLAGMIVIMTREAKRKAE